MTKPGKRLRAAKDTVERDKLYTLEEGVKLVKDAAKAKFDETIEVALNLGVDPRHADQMVRGVCQLPNGSGRKLRVGVFAKGAEGGRGQEGGRRCRRRRGSGRAGAEGRDRVRPLHRDAGHDAAGRPSR